MPRGAPGWFQLQNGDKALASLAPRDSVLYLPTSEGYAVLLSTPDPKALLAALQAGR